MNLLHPEERELTLEEIAEMRRLERQLALVSKYAQSAPPSWWWHRLFNWLKGN